jgi:inner membrane protein
MTVKSHVTTSIVVFNTILYFSVANLSLDQFYATLIIGLIIGSMFPDIDEPNSYLGSKFKLISLPTNWIIGHRTLTHNLLFYIVPLVYIIYGNSIDTYYELFLVGFLSGAILHILEDALTNSGVKYAMSPIINKFSIMPFKLRFATGGYFEKYIFLPLIFLTMISQYAFYLKFIY